MMYIISIPSFQLKESIIREQIRPTSDAAADTAMPFIDLIICPSYDVSYKKESLEKYGIDRTNYTFNGDFTPSKNTNKSISLRDIFHSISYEVEDILFSVTIFTLDRKNSMFTVNFDGSNTYDNEIVEVGTKYWNSYGRCYSIRPSNQIIQLGVKIMDFVARMNIYVYFGYPGQYMYNTKVKVNFYSKWL